MLWVEIPKDENHVGTTLLVNSFYIDDRKILANYRILEDGVSEDFEFLGKYATAERANEVYREMQELLMDPFVEMESKDGNTITMPVTWRYYKMPKE